MLDSLSLSYVYYSWQMMLQKYKRLLKLQSFLSKNVVFIVTVVFNTHKKASRPMKWSRGFYDCVCIIQLDLLYYLDMQILHLDLYFYTRREVELHKSVDSLGGRTVDVNQTLVV